MRLSKDEIQKIKDQNHTNTLYSFSRLSRWEQSRYEYFLNYVQHIKPDRNDCCYGSLGGAVHDILEKFYSDDTESGELEYDDMLEEFDDAYFTNIEVLDLKFDRNVSEQNDKLAGRWYNNVRDFFLNHRTIPYQVKCEQPAVIKVNNGALIGYIDAVYDDGDYLNIVDWKTSSMSGFTPDHIHEKSRQLILYALSFVQNGTPLEKIKCKYNMLKYCTITYRQRNGKIKSMNVERRLLNEKLVTPARIYLRQFGYDVDEYSKEVLDYGYNALPDDVKAEIKITDCWLEVPLDEKIVENTKKWAEKTIKEIEATIDEYYKTKDEALFEDSIEAVEKESYYYSTLSSFSAELNPCYKKYLMSLEKKDDIWS